MTWQILFTPDAQAMLAAIQDRRIQEKIRERINKLAIEPLKQGKALGAELTDMFSVRAVGQRYRIIYQLDGEKILILIVAIGIRKEGSKHDIYALAKKLLRLGLLKPTQPHQLPEEQTQHPEQDAEENTDLAN